MMAEIKILLVEKGTASGSVTRARLSAMGYDVPVVVDNADDAVKITRRVKPDLIIIDLTSQEELQGIKAAEQIKQRFGIPIIFIASYDEDDMPGDTLVTGIFGYLQKPLKDDKIRSTISMTLHKHTMEVMMKKFEERYHTIAELSDDLIFIVNRERVLEYANSAVLRQFNMNPDMVLGKPYLKVLSAEFIANLDDYISRVIWWGEKIHRQDRITTPHGKIWYDTTLIPLKDLDGYVNAVIVVCRDITERVRLEEQMREEGIRQIEKNNEQFQILNDQIRNPLQVIRSLMEIEGGRYGEKVLEQIALIDLIVSRLDEGWLESEKVRRFLIEHYQHGEPDDAKIQGIISH
jgi:two-component system, response regulator PdtaR